MWAGAPKSLDRRLPEKCSRTFEPVAALASGAVAHKSLPDKDIKSRTSSVDVSRYCSNKLTASSRPKSETLNGLQYLPRGRSLCRRCPSALGLAQREENPAQPSVRDQRKHQEWNFRLTETSRIEWSGDCRPCRALPEIQVGPFPEKYHQAPRPYHQQLPRPPIQAQYQKLPYHQESAHHQEPSFQSTYA